MAVKAFAKERQCTTEKGRLALQNEITIMRKLSHTNLVRLEGVYETENSVYLVLEYLRGRQLSFMLKGEYRSQLCVKSVVSSMLHALAYLSTLNIIHRDLKPENMIFRDMACRELVICDFGLATVASEPHYLFVRCGTPGFVAPEIINIRDLSTRSEPISDVFAVGVIFHCLLMGCSVFQSSAFAEIVQENRRSSFNFSKPEYGQISVTALNLLRNMLAKDPRQRITAQEALKSAFFTEEDNSQQAQAGLSSLAKMEEATEASSRRLRRRHLA